MSTASETQAPNYYYLGFIRSWVARRRIAISIACFTALIVFNLAVLRRHPGNPLEFWQWNCGLGFGLILIGLAIRSWSAGTLVKVQELITSGPYALSRNPLYVGSFLMMYGFALIMLDWLSIAFIAGPMSVLYYFQVLNEEKYLAALTPAMVEVHQQTSRFCAHEFNSNWRNGVVSCLAAQSRVPGDCWGPSGIVGLVMLSSLGVAYFKIDAKGLDSRARCECMRESVALSVGASKVDVEELATVKQHMAQVSEITCFQFFGCHLFFRDPLYECSRSLKFIGCWCPLQTLPIDQLNLLDPIT